MQNDPNSQINRHYLTIGQVSEAVSSLTGQNCTSAMIYNYERLGLLKMPERSPGGFRLFSKEDIQRVVQIKRLQDEGLLLAEILERLESAPPEQLPELDWPDQPVDRRLQILEAALRVFPKKGFAETTLQDVANEVGISGPAIYQYFKNKEELFLSLYESSGYRFIFEELTSLLQKKEDSTLEDIRQILIDMGEAFFNILSTQSEVMRLWISEARRFPQIGQHIVSNQIAPVEAQVKEFLDFYVDCGLLDIPDTPLAANAFFGLFTNVVLDQNLLFAEDYLKRPRNELVCQLVNLFLKGVKK